MLTALYNHGNKDYASQPRVASEVDQSVATKLHIFDEVHGLLRSAREPQVA